MNKMLQLLRSVVVLLLVLLPLVSGVCYNYMPPAFRKDCGLTEATKETCEASNDCCFDSSVTGLKACYHSKPANPCNPNPCVNNGVCSYSSVDGYVACICNVGFKGDLCEVVDPCYPNPCQNNGVCSSSSDGVLTCTCPGGYTGVNCEVPAVDPCNPNPCQNNGVCSSSNGVVTCLCPAGYTGDTCEVPTVDPCNPNPCQNSGVCSSSSGVVTCLCPDGYTGDTCQDLTTTTTQPTTTTTTTPTPTTTAKKCQNVIRPYQLNFTGYSLIYDVYLNGVLQTTPKPYAGNAFLADTVTAAARPSLIAIEAFGPLAIYGIMASDSEGFLSDASWKCTNTLTAGWYLTTFDDSAWPAAVVVDINGNESSTFNMDNLAATPIPTISDRASWIWSPGHAAAERAYCRFNVPSDVDPCCSSPCKNGASCIPYSNAANFSCQCVSGFTGPTCEQSPTSYQINITADLYLMDFYADGRKYDIPHDTERLVMGSLNLDYLPSVIAVAGYRAAGAVYFGFLSSDSAGYVTNNDSAWKCTMNYHIDWMLPTYDDSAWPAPTVMTTNGDETTAPASVTGITNRAHWIWAADYNPAVRHAAYCRLTIRNGGNACFSSPCKNGGICTNVAGSFSCACPAGTTGPSCRYASNVYQINITAYERVTDAYVDGVRWDLDAVDMANFHLESVINLDFMPSVIAVYSYSAADVGILASDTAGHVTDSGWKCTRTVPSGDWMTVAYDDSAWPAAKVTSVNGDQINLPVPVDDIENRAQWIWSFDGAVNYGYCRYRLPTTGNACYSSPCKNGGTCVNVGPTYTCTCPAGTSGPVCKIPSQSYQMIYTVDDDSYNIYLDGVEWLKGYVGNKLAWNLADSVQADFLPSVVAIYGWSNMIAWGMLANDTAGYVTDSTNWKCTDQLSSNWMLVDFDDSAWPAAVSLEINGNRSTSNGYHSTPIDGISQRAWWIYSPNHAVSGYVYCRLHLSLSGQACYSNPCKNGGTCTNVAGAFTCQCAAGYSGTTCNSPAASYQLSINGDNFLYGIWVDGMQYDVPNSQYYRTAGTLSLDFRPKLIAVYLKDDGAFSYGLIASDSAGNVTGPGWKCTRNVHPDWMLPSYDDSAWPAATLLWKNSDTGTGTWNAVNNGNIPLSGINLNAYWIWAADKLADRTVNWAFCRSPLYY